VSFSGSYASADVTFLLKVLPAADFVEVGDKEQLIQSGRKHYSEMLTPEKLPSPRYLGIYREACAANLPRMARDCLRLAALVAARRAGPVTLVSLARAGTPVGVILRRLLRTRFGRECAHYSVSIIRDRGIDQVALRHILEAGHAPDSIVFVDGWTGKGVISRELAGSIAAFNARHGTAIDSGLYVLSDLAGSAACAASSEDYLIPSSILNATVSGLVSRTVLSEAIGPDDFHGCVYYREFEAHDQSRAFADAVTALAAHEPLPPAQAIDRTRAAQLSLGYLEGARERYDVVDVNLIKPGIGEATRVLLRRSPRLLVVRDPLAVQVRHVILLAQEKNIPVETDPELPYHAVSLIRSAIDG
jgi:hypothetical protein